MAKAKKDEATTDVVEPFQYGTPVKRISTNSIKERVIGSVEPRKSRAIGTDGKGGLREMEFERVVEGGQPVAEPVRWRALPSGMMIRAEYALLGCQGCGKWFWFMPSSAGQTCPVCGVGILRLAKKAEAEAWFKREEDRTKAFKDNAPVRAAELKEFNKRARQDMRHPTAADDETIVRRRG